MDEIYVDFGDVSIAEQELSVNEVLSAISDVLNDKCIVISGYKDVKAYQYKKKYFDAPFLDSDIEEFDSMDEYYLFIKKLTSPVKGIKKLFTFYTGIFEITNWSGSEYRKITR